MAVSSEHQKRVRFALQRDYQVYTVPHRWNYDISQRAELWLTGKEYQDIRDDIKRISNLMSRKSKNKGRNSNFGPPQECIRGLERQTRQGAVAKKVASLDGIHAVLVEQENQQILNVFDADAIRERYVEVSAVNVLAAIEQGKKDARYDDDDNDNHHHHHDLQERNHNENCTAYNKVGITKSSQRRNRTRIGRFLSCFPGGYRS